MSRQDNMPSHEWHTAYWRLQSSQGGKVAHPQLKCIVTHTLPLRSLWSLRSFATFVRYALSLCSFAMLCSLCSVRCSPFAMLRSLRPFGPPVLSLPFSEQWKNARGPVENH